MQLIAEQQEPLYETLANSPLHLACKAGSRDDVRNEIERLRRLPNCTPDNLRTILNKKIEEKTPLQYVADAPNLSWREKEKVIRELAHGYVMMTEGMVRGYTNEAVRYADKTDNDLRKMIGERDSEYNALRDIISALLFTKHFKKSDIVRIANDIKKKDGVNMLPDKKHFSVYSVLSVYTEDQKPNEPYYCLPNVPN